MTDADRRLWSLPRAPRLQGVKFKRQAPIGRYIVDFVCFERCLVIEVDGGQHAENDAAVERTKWLEREGFRVMRFWNNEVLKNTEAALETILGAAVAAPSPVASLRDAPPSPTQRSFAALGGGGKKED